MNQFNSAFTIFLSLLVEAMPFLLLGVLFSGVLLFFVDERKLIAAIPKHPFLGALAGSAIGFLFPVCECGNVPVARRLLIQGLPPPVAIGFLLAAPTINPIVIWSTWIAFRDRPEIVILRVVFSLSVATIIAWVFSAQADLRPFLQPGVVRLMPAPKRPFIPQSAGRSNLPGELSPLLQSGTFILGKAGEPLRLETMTQIKPSLLIAESPSQRLSSRWQMLLDNTLQEMRELGGVLVVGSAIAALIQVGLPRELILSVGNGPITSILAMMVLAALVSICSTVDAFFALSFASTFTSGSLLAFLVFGPMIDLKGIGLMISVFKTRAVIYFFVLAAQLTFALTFIYQILS